MSINNTNKIITYSSELSSKNINYQSFLSDNDKKPTNFPKYTQDIIEALLKNRNKRRT